MRQKDKKRSWLSQKKNLLFSVFHTIVEWEADAEILRMEVIYIQLELLFC